MAAKAKQLKVEYVPIGDLKPNPRNPRDNDAMVDAVVGSIEAFGYTNPILARRADKRVIAGHTRLKALAAQGAKTAPVIFLDLTATQAATYAIADNKLSERTPWDVPTLTELIEELEKKGVDLALTGFEPAEIADMNALAAGGATEGQIPDDQVPEPPKKAITKPGDLWILGNHRLLCGDCTETPAVVRLLGDARARLMNTDPPYGVAYANDERPNPGVAKPRVANDTLQDDVLQAFLTKAFTAAVTAALKPDAAWYLWHAHLTQGFFAAAAADAADVLLHRQIIWVKQALLLGRGQYHWKHEPCFMGWVRGNQPPDYGRGAGERDQTTVWEVGSVTAAERREFDHATTKPVELFTIPIVKHLKTGEACYEPFAGSGPQFIAAEKLGRRCYGLEIEPKYCDVIVERWQQFSGGKAQRQNGKVTGGTIREKRAEAPKEAGGKGKFFQRGPG